MSLLALNRTLLLLTLLLAPLPTRADDAPPADREVDAAFAEKMARCVSDLSSADLEVRREAIEELQDADVAALPALEEGAVNSQRARSLACFNLIQRLVNSDDEAISTPALEAVRRLSESEEGGVAGRARSILAAVALTGESTAIAMLEAAGCRVRRLRTGEVAYVTGIESDRELALLKSLSFGRVSMLSMSGEGITDDGVKNLAEVPAVRSLSIYRTSITDAGLKTLSELQNVDSLNLGSGNYTDDGLRELGRSSGFRSLTMSDVAPEHLPVLSEIPQLRSLNFNNPQFSGTDIELLNDLNGINMSLNLRDATDDDLRQVSHLKHLSALDVFSRDELTDDGIASLSGLSLERLTISAPQLTDDALLHLGKIKSLTLLFLMGGRISDAGLRHLHNLNSLRSLALNRTGVTDAGLQDLREALPNLRIINDFQNPVIAPPPRPPVRPPELDEREREQNQQLAGILSEDERDALDQLTRREQLRSEVRVTVNDDDGLVNLHFRRSLTAEDTELLQQISKLGVVFLSGSRNTATDEDLSHLRGVEMRGVSIRKATVSDAGLTALTTCPNLESLTLNETQVTDAGLAHLGEMSQLIRLSLGTGAFTDAGLEHVASLDQLVSLSLTDCSALTDHGLRHLSSLVNLEGLMLGRIDGLTSESLTHLTGLRKLKTLRINSMQLNQADLAHVSSLDNLETLSISASNLSDEGLQHIARLPALKELYIGGSDVTDAGLAHLAGSSGLTRLILDGTNVTDAGMAHLVGMKELSSLSLEDTSVTAAGLEHFKQMTAMQELDLTGTRIGDEGLRLLGSMPALETLRLEGTQVTDAGLEHLQRLEKLTYLRVGGTNVTPAGVERLERELPECNVNNVDHSRIREEMANRLEELRARVNARRRP